MAPTFMYCAKASREPENGMSGLIECVFNSARSNSLSPLSKMSIVMKCAILLKRKKKKILDSSFFAFAVRFFISFVSVETRELRKPSVLKQNFLKKNWKTYDETNGDYLNLLSTCKLWKRNEGWFFGNFLKNFNFLKINLKIVRCCCLVELFSFVWCFFLKKKKPILFLI